MIPVLLISMIVLAVIGMPLAFAMGIAATLGIAAHDFLPFALVPQRIMNALDKFPFLAVPMFVLAGELMNTSGITDRIIRFCVALVGHVRGGLAQVNVLASIFFAGISGSATADAAGLGKLLIPAMIKEGFDDDYSVAVTAASSTVGPIIPPSGMLIIYASMTNLSIGKLFLAGVFPGLLLGFSVMVLAYIYAVKRNYPREPWQGLVEMWRAFKSAIFALFAPFIIVFGIVSGVFTATETGTVVVFYALALGFAYGELNARKIYRALQNALESTVVILFIIASASILGWLLAMGKFPIMLVDLLNAVTSDVNLMIFLIVITLLILGLVMDGMAILVILVPVLSPVALAIGLDPIHFAILMVVSVMLGGITPPVGILLYISCQVSNVPLSRTTPMIWGFVFVMLVAVLMVAYFPPLATWLPDVLFD
ncbi:MAG: TRAP transporter large permease [Rhodospirillales bacterium]|nr:TRAP transporter large permease [Rhodospirillales bacterium]